ncbi:hypothetical protein ACGFMM_07640 [Streptomyces sp. NPDC048604]|uniref:hypothetical protein n=1 Tax=Streptomyces sp. NPDC048604 TaxID=3365578 RepID=UPI0037211068
MTLAQLVEGTGQVRRSELAQHTGRSAATVGDCMGFLADVGLVRADRGLYAITDEGREFAELWPRDSARARLLLHPLLARHWSASAAARLLADGPLPQEELAASIRAGLPGVPLRGMYLVEWLVIGLVLVRDEQLRVHLAPAGGHRPTSGRTDGPAAGEAAPGPSGDGASQARPGLEPDSSMAEPPTGITLLGLTLQEVQALPDARYAAFLDGVLQSLRGAHAPTA